jgi:hypothetical protein
MKRALLPIALTVGVGLFAGTGAAVAAPPTPIEPTTVKYDCPGGTIDAVVTGKMKVIDAPVSSVNKKGGKLLKVVGAASTVTLTGPAPASKVMSFSQNGSLSIAYISSPEFDVVLTVTGRNLISDPKHGDYPGGLFLTVGKVFWSLNAPDYPNGGLTGPGKITDVCALLAP